MNPILATRLGVLLVAGALAAAPVRAQFTETALTAEPGRWLVESDVLNLGHDDTSEGRYRYLAIGYVQASRGWTARGDVQVALQTFLREDFDWREEGAADERFDRQGELYLRGKWRVYGDGEQGLAVSLLPYLRMPLQHDAEEHRFADLGLIVPFSRGFGESWWVDAQVQVEGRKRAGAPREAYWLASANLQRTWNDAWGSYLEVLADFWERRVDSAAVSAGLGVTRRLGARGGCDVAVYRALSDEAIDWEFALRVYWKI